MKTLKNFVNEINGLRFMVENLKLNSGIGKKFLLAQKIIVNESELKAELWNLSQLYDFVNKSENSKSIFNICNLLEHVNDIHSTIKNLHNSRVLDDVELFEIKKFCIVSQSILEELRNSDFNVLQFHDSSKIIDALDPEHSGIQSFYIYSAYNSHLEELRKKQNEMSSIDKNLAEKYRLDCVEIEDNIRQKLSKELSVYSKELQHNLDQLAYLDVLIAKSIQATELNLCQAEISTEITEYKSIFNPQISDILHSQSKEFQAVDIKLYNKPCLITGANMSGKTVLLKTIALAQYLFQFGFFVPAKSAKIVLVDEVMLSVGDNQSELNGLSSFAVEMLNVNNILTQVKTGTKVLVLVDELARTTNPDEGKAFVNAFVEMMSDYNVRCLITTHYSGISTNCRRLRVKGLIIGNETKNVSVENINDFMDYSLSEIHDDNIPAEAIRIAEILGVDEELIAKTKRYLTTV